MSPMHESDSLRRQYDDRACLHLRQEIHDRYSVPRIDFPEWVLSRVHWRGDERLLDVGSGSGAYDAPLRRRWPNVQAVAVDQSLHMLEAHPRRATTAAADALRLPFPRAMFDVVMANHMLYHVSDIESALREFRRVLKPDGILITATNSLQTMPELNALLRRAIMLLSGPGNLYAQPPMPIHHLYALENGVRYLARHFYAVVRHDLPQMLVFHEADPVIAYFESWRPMVEPQLPAGIDWSALMLVMREQVERMLGHFGELSVNKISGVLVASDRGGFIRDFQRLCHPDPMR